MVEALSSTSGLLPENLHKTSKWALFSVQFLRLHAMLSKQKWSFWWLLWLFWLSKAGPLDSGFWTCQIDGVKEYCVDMCLWRLVVNSSAQLFSSKITNEFVGKLDIFCVQFVGHVFFSVYVFNNLNISHSFPGENVKGACSLLSTIVL
jgi:hypothetical protein